MEKPGSTNPIMGSRRAALANFVIEGTFSAVMASLTGGIFLTGFALLLGASKSMIGLLTALPSLATVVQFAGAFLVERSGRNKGLHFSGLLVAGEYG